MLFARCPGHANRRTTWQQQIIQNEKSTKIDDMHIS